MGFNLKVSNQVCGLESELKGVLYRFVHTQVAHRSRFSVLIIGIGTGCSSGLLTVSKQIALIFEAILKGGINIVCAAFTENADCLVGVRQLCFDAPMELIQLPFSVISALAGVFTKPFYLVKSPSKYAEKKWLKHDPLEKKAREEAEKVAEFKRAADALQQNPENVDNRKRLASYYFRGHGTPKNISEAVIHYTKAAEKGDVQSMMLLAEIFENSVTEESRENSFNWYEKAAKADDPQGMYKVGLICWNLPERREEGFEWLKKAALSNHSPSQAFLQNIHPNPI